MHQICIIFDIAYNHVGKDGDGIVVQHTAHIDDDILNAKQRLKSFVGFEVEGNLYLKLQKPSARDGDFILSSNPADLKIIQNNVWP